MVTQVTHFSYGASPAKSLIRHKNLLVVTQVTHFSYRAVFGRTDVL